MRKTLYYCDWCGRDITTDVKHAVEIFGLRDKRFANWSEIDEDDEEAEYVESYKRELCGDCVGRLKNFLRKKDEGEKEE